MKQHTHTTKAWKNNENQICLQYDITEHSIRRNYPLD